MDELTMFFINHQPLCVLLILLGFGLLIWLEMMEEKWR